MFANITIERNGLHNLSADLRAVGTHVKRFGPPVVRGHAELLQVAVRERALGRPGPRRITGRYIDSIKVGTGAEGVISRGFAAEVYTDEPYARRLEFGFVGVDSLGRHYDQPPYPHWGPAVEEVDHRFFEAMDSVVKWATIRARHS